MQTCEISLDSFDFNYEKLRSRNPGQEKRLLACLGDSGQQSPIIVVRSGETGRYIVIDGHKRVRALKRLKADVAKAAVWEMAEAEALAGAYQMGAQGRRDAFEEGWLVAELHRRWKWSLSEVAKRLVRSKSWVSKRLALVEEMPEWMSQEVAGGRIGAHAAANYLVPLTRGNPGQGRLLMERIRGLGLTNRQLGEIYASYQSADPETRKKIVEDPSLFLKAKAAAREDLGLSEKQNQSLKNLVLIGNISLGLARGLAQVLGDDPGEGPQIKFRAAWRRCQECFAMLGKSAQALLPPGGSYAG